MTRTESLRAIADMLFALNEIDDSDAPDMLDAFRALNNILAPYDFRAIAEMTDLCPIHFCDIEICIDDELTCSKLFGIPKSR